METNTTITITLKEILNAIKNMQVEELEKIQSALNVDTHSIIIDVSVSLGEDFKHVKVNPSIVDTLRDWPKSVPSYLPPINLPYKPWPHYPSPDYSDPLNPWKITSDVNSATILSEDSSNEQMCHKLNISGTDSNSFYDKDYIDKLFRR